MFRMTWLLWALVERTGAPSTTLVTATLSSTPALARSCETTCRYAPKPWLSHLSWLSLSSETLQEFEIVALLFLYSVTKLNSPISLCINGATKKLWLASRTWMDLKMKFSDSGLNMSSKKKCKILFLALSYFPLPFHKLKKLLNRDTAYSYH